MKYCVLSLLLAFVGLVVSFPKRCRSVGLALLLGSVILGILKIRPTQWEDVTWYFFAASRSPVEIVLAPGQSISDFSRQAQVLGLVADSGNLRYFLERSGLDRTLVAGVYSVTPGASWQVTSRLKDARPLFFKVTIIPGAFPTLPFGVRWSAATQRKAIMNDALYPTSLRPLLPQTLEGRAALLLPDTYNLSVDTPEALVKATSLAWWKNFGSADLTTDVLHRNAVIASLLQREARIDAEYPIIAGVIENRLAKKMPLQIDASIVYAWARKGVKVTRVLFRHLEIDSPYNTYRNMGLPPDPICVPSAAAWNGALHPEKNDYLYYVAKDDISHTFSRTEAEHDVAVKEYRTRKVKEAVK